MASHPVGAFLMNARSVLAVGSVFSGLVIGLLAVPEVQAFGRGGHSGGGGHAPRPPRVSAPRQSFSPPKMPHVAAPSHMNNPRPQAMARNAQGRPHNGPAHANNTHARLRNTQAHANANNTRARTGNSQSGINSTRPFEIGAEPAGTGNSQSGINSTRPFAIGTQSGSVNAQTGVNSNGVLGTRSSMLGNTHPTLTAGTNMPVTRANTFLPNSVSTTGTATGSTLLPTTVRTTGAGLNNTVFPNTYRYGSGSGARMYRAYGYGRGYRNNYYGSRYGYGRSQGNNRAIIARLRSVHASLARIDHDYQGHRVRAMHSISMAIRQLSNRSMNYRNTGFGAGMMNMNVNNGRALGMQGGLGGGMRQGGVGGGMGRRGQPMTQAQSDSRMSQDLRTLEGISMQLTNQGYNTTSHARARGHVQYAIHELTVALSIR